VKPLATLEAILGIHGKTMENVESVEDEVRGPSLPNTEKHGDAEEKSDDRLIRLTAFVAYCELGLSCLSVTALTHSQSHTVEEKSVLTEKNTLDKLNVPGMLKDQDPECQGRACAAFPALCDIQGLRNKLLNADSLRQIIKLCRTPGQNQSTAARTLSFLAQHFG